MVYMYHSFLIHSSADGHLGCFHVLAIINSSLGRYTLKYFILFVAMVNGPVPLISLPDFSLLVYKSASYFLY